MLYAWKIAEKVETIEFTVEKLLNLLVKSLEEIRKNLQYYSIQLHMSASVFMLYSN